MWILQESSRNWNSCTMGMWNGTGCMGWVFYTIAKMLCEPSRHAPVNGRVNQSTSSWWAGTLPGLSLVYLAPTESDDSWWTVAGTSGIEQESKGLPRWVSESQH